MIAGLLFSISSSAFAWEHRAELTRLSLAGWDRWEEASFEPIEKVLPSLEINGVKVLSRGAFDQALEINSAKVNWDERPPAPEGADSLALTIVAWSSESPDQGMDSDLNLGSDQEVLGSGLPSQSYALRHMYLLPFDWRQPFVTLHIPYLKRAVGQAPERAQIFYDLAIQAKRSKHWFWAYRFLGMALNYIEDLNHPYLCHRFGSVAIAPWSQWFIKGQSAFLSEADRIVGNLRIGFDKYSEYIFHSGSAERRAAIENAFKVPQATELLKNVLDPQSDIEVRSAGVLMARAATMLAPMAVGAELGVFGKDLEDGQLNFSKSFVDEKGRAKLDFEKFETSRVKEIIRHRDLFRKVSVEVLSNVGVSVRWVFDRFRQSR